MKLNARSAIGGYPAANRRYAAQYAVTAATIARIAISAAPLPRAPRAGRRRAVSAPPAHGRVHAGQAGQPHHTCWMSSPRSSSPPEASALEPVRAKHRRTIAAINRSARPMPSVFARSGPHNAGEAAEIARIPPRLLAGGPVERPERHSHSVEPQNKRAARRISAAPGNPARDIGIRRAARVESAGAVGACAPVDAASDGSSAAR